MRPETLREDARLWRSLHWLLALIIPFLILFLVSCIRATEEPEDLGPKENPAEIQKVLDEALVGNTYANGKAGQYVYYEENISAQGGVYQDRGSTFVYVKDAQDHPNNPNVLQLSMYYERRELNDDGEFVTTKTDELFNWNKDEVTTNGVIDASRARIAQAVGQLKMKSGVQASARPAEPIRTTYHHFEVRRGDIYPVPEAVKVRADCGGLVGCKYNALFVKLDEVRWYSETDYDKFHYDFVYNKTTPFLYNIKSTTMGGLMVLGCVSTYIPYDGRKIYIRDCIQLKDFQK